MSVPLLRQARIPQTLFAAHRTISRCRSYAVLAAQPRHNLETSDSDPVAGPSGPNTSPGSSQPRRKLGPRVENADSEPQEPSSRVQSYLASINVSGHQPTLADLDRCRPPERPSVHSPKYVTAYNELVNTISRSFTKEQLRNFLKEALGLNGHSATSRKKIDYAESILEQIWQWPKLSDVEKAKRDRTEVVTKTLPFPVHELFLVLGRDGADLLRMSQDYDVHIALRQKPLALRVEGTRASVRELSAHISSLKQTFAEEVLDLPSKLPIPLDMVQRISRLAQAYLENVSSSPGKVRVYARNPQALEEAKRLTIRTIREIEEISRTPVLAHLPAGTSSHVAEPLAMYPHTYSLYPFVSPGAFPFFMNTSGAFRLRRVGEWLSSGYQEDIADTEGLAGGKGHFLTESEKSVQLQDILLRVLSSGLAQSNLTIKASFGHMLLTRASKDQRATLVPPLTGQHLFGKIRKWIASNTVKMSFVPDLPLPLLSTSPMHQKVIHRLVYHSISLGSDNRLSPPEDSPADVHTLSRKVLSLEVALAQPKGDQPEDPSRAVQQILDDLQSPDEDVLPRSESSVQWPADPTPPVMSEERCWTGVEADVNVMMPDRPMDLQFTASHSTDLPESQQPAELRRYIRELREYLNGADSQPEQPNPPLAFELEGTRFLLHANVSVRQSQETVTGSKVSPDDKTLTQALCESILDLESNQKTVRCEVTCANPTSEASWKRFLAHCDELSVVTHRVRDGGSVMDRMQDIV